MLVVHTQGQFSGSFKLIRGKKCFSTHPIPHICNSSYEVHLYHGPSLLLSLVLCGWGHNWGSYKERVQRSLLRGSDFKFFDKAQCRALEISFHFSKSKMVLHRSSYCPRKPTEYCVQCSNSTILWHPPSCWSVMVLPFWQLSGYKVTFWGHFKKGCWVCWGSRVILSFPLFKDWRSKCKAYQTGKFRKWIACARPLSKLIFVSRFRLTQLGSTACLAVSLFLLFCFL